MKKVFLIEMIAFLLLVGVTMSFGQSRDVLTDAKVITELDPRVFTDKVDYYPGDTVLITGTGWLPGENILMVFELSTINPHFDTLYTVADAEGNFFNNEYLIVEEHLGESFELTATGLTSGGIATCVFTDVPKVGSVTVSAQVGTLTYGTSGSVTYTVTVNRGSGGGSSGSFTADLSITASLPSGATASFSPNPVSFTPTDNSKTATLTISTTASTPAGSTTFTVKAATSASDYAVNNGTLSIGKATPTITWNNPADIVYGTALSGTQLNATASVAGSFVYSPIAGTVLNAGNDQTLSVTFTPTDGANYNATTKNILIDVLKRSITVTANAGQTKIYGNSDPLPFTYSITSGSLASGDVFDGTLVRVTGEVVGTYAINQGTLTIKKGSVDVISNYNFTYNSANFAITKRSITITADAKSKTYGDADPALTYQITSGSLAFSDDFTGELSRVSGENVGAYAITQGTVALNNNYTLTYVGANLTIGK
ncbi:MAG: MBG domain-containing protein, partial [Bacteroidota bacterium]|nr:MBG domain-containing protein [Bacteroidota bacterium]